MPFDQGGLEILDAEECRSLLAAASLGRIVFTDRALPAIQPVNFAFTGDDVVVRTSASSRLAAAAGDAVVAFEIDDFDATDRSGWSVVVVGRAHAVTDSADLAALRDLPLHPWAPGERDHFLRIRADIITGRRIPDGGAHPHQHTSQRTV
ncbi:pyridoxamine 5'-phosphate oxidase family protein [Actinomadura sp. 21ATH]|uniref:pyridoxamine 5'-phosphate oxidase family protein n=1 Tax=Actinomadura sp. 21ATH TaxID=1735444 RepID=UPI0035C13C60